MIINYLLLLLSDLILLDNQKKPENAGTQQINKGLAFVGQTREESLPERR